jgi:hypothetical protein
VRGAAGPRPALVAERADDVSGDPRGRRQCPSPHVENVVARNQIVCEPREISQADDVTVKYHTRRDARTSLEDIGVQLMADGSGVKSVAWDHPNRERA